MIGCVVTDVKDVTELAPLLFVPHLLFAGNQLPSLFRDLIFIGVFAWRFFLFFFLSFFYLPTPHLLKKM